MSDHPEDIPLVELPPGLRPSFVKAFRFIEMKANRGEYVRGDDLDDAIGTDNSSGSTQTGVCRALERRGLIQTRIYQRGRQFIVTATGKESAEPANKTPHWRTVPRPAKLPGVALASIQARRPDLAGEIIAAARSEGLSVQDFLLELLWTGWQDRGQAIRVRNSAPAGAEGQR
jgi:hypothetical protein